MAVGQGSLAGYARVSYEATGLADFENDNRRAEAVYRDTTRGMSDEAIRLELAQDKLRRSLAKGPTAYREQARAELEVRRSEAALRVENERLERSFRDTGRTLDRAGRGALLGSGAFRGLARSVTFASASFLGSAGIVYGMRQAINIASNLEEQTDKMRRVFGQASGEIEQLGRSSAVQMGIARDAFLEYVSTFGALLRPIGIVGKASADLSSDLIRRGTDLASFYNRDVKDALEALRSGVVGESEPLRTFGVRLSEARVQKEALAATGKKLATQLTDEEKLLARIKIIMDDSSIARDNFRETSDGLANSERQLAALWRDTQGLLGQAIIPSYRGAVQGLRDWLAEEENQKELQRTLNQLVADGVQVIRGLGAGLNVAKEAAEPLVDALGGVGNTIEAITIAWIAFKAKAVLGFGGTAAASTATSAKMVRDATIAGRAWDIATRPRLMTVTTVGGGVPTGTTGVPGRGGRGRFPGLPILTSNPALLTTAAILASSGASGAQEVDVNQYPLTRDLMNRVAAGGKMSAGERRLWRMLDGGKSLDQQRPEVLARVERGLRRLYEGVAAPGEGATRPTGGTRRRGGRGDRGPRPFTFERLESQLAASDERRLDAEASPGTADDVREEKRRLALINRGLRELELTRDQRIRLKQERIAILQELARIDQAEDQEAARIAEERKRKREAAQKKEEERLERLQESAMRAAERQRKKFRDLEKFDLSTRAGLRKAALRGVDETVAGLKKKAEDEKGLTAAQVHAMQFEFLSRLTGDIGQFGSNFESDSGQIATQSHVQTQLMRDQNAALHRLIEGTWHPGAQLASADLSAAGWGVGF